MFHYPIVLHNYHPCQSSVILHHRTVFIFHWYLSGICLFLQHTLATATQKKKKKPKSNCYILERERERECPIFEARIIILQSIGVKSRCLVVIAANLLLSLLHQTASCWVCFYKWERTKPSCIHQSLIFLALQFIMALTLTLIPDHWQSLLLDFWSTKGHSENEMISFR